LEDTDELKETLSGFRKSIQNHRDLNNKSLERSRSRSKQQTLLTTSGSKASYLKSYNNFIQPPMRFTSQNPLQSRNYNPKCVNFSKQSSPMS